MSLLSLEGATIMTHKGMTLTRHLMEQERQHPSATGDFTGLLVQMTLAAKIISREVNKAGLVDILGFTGEQNVQDEAVQKLDVFANQTIIQAFEHSGHVCLMASEESAEPILLGPDCPRGKYVLLFDPLDGSSNIDANITIGTIFSVHRKTSEGTDGAPEDLLQPGNRQVAAGYVVYGSSTMLVYTAGNGVHGYTLDPSVGEFLLSRESIQMPERNNICSANEGNYTYWHPEVQCYIDYLYQKDPASQRPYSTRYVGSLVADFHRTLLYGGIFLYPADTKDPKQASGKLRLLYEAAPLALIAREAGGRAINGPDENILDVQPTALHQRVPLFIGSREDVAIAQSFLQEAR
ncbi:Fructose-1,6-bisphosphatase class 1 [Candidatus Entotheonellaceae bacterium PAL068K]